MKLFVSLVAVFTSLSAFAATQNLRCLSVEERQLNTSTGKALAYDRVAVDIKALNTDWDNPGEALVKMKVASSLDLFEGRTTVPPTYPEVLFNDGAGVRATPPNGVTLQIHGMNKNFEKVQGELLLGRRTDTGRISGILQVWGKLHRYVTCEVVK